LALRDPDALFLLLDIRHGVKVPANAGLRDGSRGSAARFPAYAQRVIDQW
jgi:hypothetical protein